jgi:L-lactate dehydrogenase complex protein LldG
MNSRDSILTKLRASIAGRGDPDFVAQRDAFTEEPDANPLERYIELAEAEATTISSVADWLDVPDAVARYLQANGLSLRVVIDSQAPVAASAWSDVGVETVTLPLNKDGDAFLSDCYGAVAESGAIVISSNDGTAIANDFLAETHIILLRASWIFLSLADLWQTLRDEAAGGLLPREFCLVTGPSRTADLGVPAKMGAHGPARVHVVIVDA